MGSKKIRQHTIDFIFPIALFFVFAASALVALLLSANIYRHVTESSAANFTSGTSLFYITEKVRQKDANGAVYTDTFDGCDALVMEEQYGEKSYLTYIYEYNGALRELFIEDGVSASAESGSKIMDVKDFQIDSPAEGVFRFTCTSAEGETETAMVSVHTQSPAENNALIRSQTAGADNTGEGR